MTKGKNTNNKGVRSGAANNKQMTWKQHVGKLVDIGGRSGIEGLKKRLGLNTEDHIFQDATTLAVIPGVGAGWAAAGTAGAPPIIPQGNTNQTRVGDSIRVTRMYWRVGITSNVLQTVGTRVRVVGTVRRYSEGAGMSSAVPNTSVFTSTGLLDSQFSPNMKNDGIRVFYDRTVTIAAPGVDNVGHTLEIELNDIHMRWTQADSSGVLANLCENEMTLWISYDSNASGGLGADSPQYNVTRTTEFVDN